MANAAAGVRKRFGIREVTGDNLDVVAQVLPRCGGASRENSDTFSVAAKHVHNL
jgi:hypothetical protein